MFSEAGAIAAGSGFAGCAVAIVGSLWRARQNKNVTTYGSSRWATLHEIEDAGLFRPAGVFLGQLAHRYLCHDGPEHVMAFDCVRHASMFFNSPDLDLATAKPGTFSLSPSDSMIADLARDYRAMTGMIFGNVPTFDQVIASVARLEHLVNS